MKPVVAIVGRANVGKSTLFTPLAGGSLAIGEGLPGTTRDRVFADVSWQGREVTLVDTGGLELVAGSSLAQKVKDQAEAAIAEADVIIFMVDIRDGIIAADRGIGGRLRTCHKPVILAANKADNIKLESQTADFYQLGVGAPLAISVLHGRGISDLWQAIAHLLPEPSIGVVVSDRPNLAIGGGA